MGFNFSINIARRQLMKSLTKNIGKTYKEPKFGHFKIDDIKDVLIIRPNHRLGNQLLLTPVVQEVINTFPQARITLLVKGGVAFPVFKNYSQIVKIIQLPRKPFSNLFKYVMQWFLLRTKKYDLVVNGDKSSSSGKLLTQLSRGKIKIFGNQELTLKNKYPDYVHISKSPIYNLRYHLDRLGINSKQNELPVLNIKLTEDEILKGEIVLRDLIKNDKNTICIYTNATGDKCYSETWWEEFYSKLLKECSEYNIVEMLPIENISKINFKAPNFYSQDIREMAAIIKNTSLFIAADNGVMHLASASLTPCVGFFSVTDERIYGPYGNNSIALNTNYTNLEHWIEEIKKILEKQPN